MDKDAFFSLTQEGFSALESRQAHCVIEQLDAMILSLDELELFLDGFINSKPLFKSSTLLQDDSKQVLFCADNIKK